MKVEAVEAEEGLIKSSSMLLPAFSGILAAIRRIISRREYTKVSTEWHFMSIDFGFSYLIGMYYERQYIIISFNIIYAALASF